MFTPLQPVNVPVYLADDPTKTALDLAEFGAIFASPSEDALASMSACMVQRLIQP